MSHNSYHWKIYEGQNTLNFFTAANESYSKENCGATWVSMMKVLRLTNQSPGWESLEENLDQGSSVLPREIEENYKSEYALCWPLHPGSV